MRKTTLASLIAFCNILSVTHAQNPPKAVDSEEYRTVLTAKSAAIEKSGSATQAGKQPYLGIVLDSEKRGKAIVLDVDATSPAGKAGISPRDIISKIEGKSIRSREDLKTQLMSRHPGDEVTLSWEHERKKHEVKITLDSVSRPLRSGGPKVMLGVQTGDPVTGGGVSIQRITTGSPAEKIGLREGDVLVKLDKTPIDNADRLQVILSDRDPGSKVAVVYRREGKDVEATAELVEDPQVDPNQGQPRAQGRSTFKKDTFRLAIVGIEYPDQKHNDKITNKDWEEMFFSKGSYLNKNNATGQPVYGSLNDFYDEVSCKTFKMEGKCFEWVEISKPRDTFTLGTAQRNANMMTEAMDKIVARDGKDALKDFDGVFFLYAGTRVSTNRGGIYWPHRSTVNYKGRRLPYIMCPEGGSRMANISVFCHEFGHIIGLPDLYARPENPGSEGLGIWCLMSNEAGNGRPQHMSAWCKEQLGWLQPTVVDPTEKQKLVLGPVEGSPKECFKVLLKKDGSEYLLLENRRKQGFDQSLPAQGLLIWRVVGGHPILEESHGIEGPNGPRVFLSSVPYPSPSNNSFTPFTTPSSRALMGGGLPVYITNIHELPDGKIAFCMGYEFD